MEQNYLKIKIYHKIVNKQKADLKMSMSDKIESRAT